MASRILFVLIAIIVVVFAVSNRAMTTVSFWPFGFELLLPLSIFILSVFVLGFLLGTIVTKATNLFKRKKTLKT
ncbi:MAG: DUF1049 domain-containing protein [Alphaproteobacteria bacterium]|jgi:uncharacterized integral membrane protein|nr:DUF1049 domain-containing protein [Alphaproteobacteria bacterium]MBT5390173.1 DUF1049 domain-containing protein [Alphaproteobacteria bacterium]MBT5541091.1 DUF1049 domain-containing protein [Alphaproteobacteria bacterium]MBT5654606.1 DUF1049 domain-containing protein [Alphaproteobacteria bacterium]